MICLCAIWCLLFWVMKQNNENTSSHITIYYWWTSRSEDRIYRRRWRQSFLILEANVLEFLYNFGRDVSWVLEINSGINLNNLNNFQSFNTAALIAEADVDGSLSTKKHDFYSCKNMNCNRNENKTSYWYKQRFR